jgi:hypothetical protein
MAREASKIAYKILRKLSFLLILYFKMNINGEHYATHCNPSIPEADTEG